MESLFDKSTSTQLISRVKNLNPEAQRHWGKMSVSQMLVHAQKPFQTAFGEIELKRGLISFLIGGIARKALTNSKPFTKNLPTAKDFIISTNPEFETERIKLINLIQKFTEGGPHSLTKKPHPFFGNMSTHEWDRLMYKHLDHHLRQFGA